DILPSTESHVAALSRCNSDQQAAEVWQQVVEQVEDPKKITASTIKKLVDAAIGYTPPAKDYLKAAMTAIEHLTPEQRVAVMEFLNSLPDTEESHEQSESLP